jgi:uncharacterized repeat protein (TIGR02543 family)
MNGRTCQTTTVRSSRAFRRYGLTLTVPAVLALSVLTAAPAWAAIGVTHSSAPRHASAVAGDNSRITVSSPTISSGGSEIGARAVPGLYHCAKSTTCDIAHANMNFTNYSSVCAYQDCTFASAANWEKVVLGLDTTVTTLKGEYANAGETFYGGQNIPQLWRYWRTQGVNGATAEKITPYSRSRASTENAVSKFGALIAKDVATKGAYIGTTQYSGGIAIMVIDGFDPKGPLVVYQAKTIQMTWAQWNTQVKGMWGVTATVVPATAATVTFSANGGTGVMAVETEGLNAATALTPNGFAYTGYSFSGWNTAANGSGTSYANDAVYSFAASVTLYAQWTIAAPTTATVTFSANGGIGTMALETETLNVSASLATNVFTRTGYTFSGWNTDANGSGTAFTNGEVVQFTSSVTFYAQWTAIPITIPFTGTASSNWSGYVLPTSTIVTYASGQWTVPTLNCTDTPNSNTSTWVGTGGETWSSGGWSGSLLQTGIEDNCVNGVQQDSGWWEIVPATPNHEETFSNFPVNPGDSILAEVYQSTSGQWVTVVQDLTTGLQGVMETGGSWYVTTITNNTLIGGIQGDASGVQYAGSYTAEWIQEDVTNMIDGSLFPLANFGTVTFTNLETSLSSWFLPNSDALEITNSSNVPVSVPTTVSNNGFTVDYTGA